MQVQNEIIEQDGSAWASVVVVKGVIYRASYVAGKIQCALGPYKHAPAGRPRWALESVKKWAEKRVAELPKDWHEAHNAMYA